MGLVLPLFRLHLLKHEKCQRRLTKLSKIWRWTAWAEHGQARERLWAKAGWMRTENAQVNVDGDSPLSIYLAENFPDHSRSIMTYDEPSCDLRGVGFL